MGSSDKIFDCFAMTVEFKIRIKVKSRKVDVDVYLCRDFPSSVNANK